MENRFSWSYYVPLILKGSVPTNIICMKTHAYLEASANYSNALFILSLIYDNDKIYFLVSPYLKSLE